MIITSTVAAIAIALSATAKSSTALLFAKGAVATALLARAAAVWRGHREFRVVARMNRADLGDIGLTPADVDYASHLPFYRDPTVALARAIEERRNV